MLISGKMGLHLRTTPLYLDFSTPAREDGGHHPAAARPFRRAAPSPVFPYRRGQNGAPGWRGRNRSTLYHPSYNPSTTADVRPELLLPSALPRYT